MLVEEEGTASALGLKEPARARRGRREEDDDERFVVVGVVVETIIKEAL